MVIMAVRADTARSMSMTAMAGIAMIALTDMTAGTETGVKAGVIAIAQGEIGIMTALTAVTGLAAIQIVIQGQYGRQS